MFGWLRHWWSGGQVPPKPCDSELDWPDEEEWAFDYDAWKWKRQPKTHNPYSYGWEDDWADVAENRPVILEDIPMAEVIEEPHQCCGGSCKLPPPLPPPDDPIWSSGPVVVAAPPGPTAVYETEAPPVVGVYETETPPSATSPPIIVSG